MSSGGLRCSFEMRHLAGVAWQGHRPIRRGQCFASDFGGRPQPERSAAPRVEWLARGEYLSPDACGEVA
ncbi:MAG: hypothetical protein EA377_06615 [Phycisphaerales bacterium]|nr:MAG: hypothetical protein EA377_06615 [Phycisphaerales bacterium]